MLQEVKLIKVYIVYGWIEWEGDSTLAIFDTKEKAEFYVKYQRKNRSFYDGYGIREWDVR